MYSCYGLLETLETLGLPLLLLIEVPESLSHMLRLLSCCSIPASAGSISVDAPATRGSAPVHAGLGGTSAGLLYGYTCADAPIYAPGLAASFIYGKPLILDVLKGIKLCYYIIRVYTQL